MRFFSALTKKNLTVIAVALMLSACGGDVEVSRQYCPTEGVLADTERLVFERDGQLAWAANITGTAMDCAWNPETRKIETSLSVRGLVEAQGVMPTKLSLPAFMIILNGQDDVMTRKDFMISVSGNKNAEQAVFVQEIGRQAITLSEDDRIEDFSILVGFRLSADQLKKNRLDYKKRLNLL